MRTTRDRRPRDTDSWGIVRGFRATTGEWRTTSRETVRALRTAMGAPDEPPRVTIRIHWIAAGTRATVPRNSAVLLEDGAELKGMGRLPPDLPLGYHTLRHHDGRTEPLIVHPKACFLPPDLRAWGWITQLYALRSQASWGMGDFRDLLEMGRWSRRSLGAGFLLVNPLAAAAPVVPQESSPYSPVSRRFLNPLYLRIEDIPGAPIGEIKALAQAGRDLNQHRLLERDTVFRLKMQALERIWKRVRARHPDTPVSGFSADALRSFAAYCVVAEAHGADWRRWPQALRHPSSAAVRRFVHAHEDRVRFHEWLQGLLAEQLDRAAAEVPLVHDLPIGFTPGGADAWVWQDLLAQGVSVGAPPDSFNPAGQDWGLPPFVPSRLRETVYLPVRQTLQTILSHGAGLRIDHVMGLFRLFWIPSDSGPQRGAYVRYPSDELLAIVALESARAQAVVIGEDLGTVEPGVRRSLRQRRILSYRVLWFESKPPDSYPQDSLATVTTHDLPTVAGLWTGSDFQSQEAAGLKPVAAQFAKARRHLQRVARAPSSASASAVATGIHQRLGAAPSRLVAATLEDALVVEERPNMPGTTIEWPNWSRALPQSLEKIRDGAVLKQIAREFRKFGRHGSLPTPRKAQLRKNKGSP